jgi:glycosyltransferase involved in cell wall biosynthesis
LNLPITHHVERRLALTRSQVVYYGIPDALGGESSDPVDAGTMARPFTFVYVGRLVSEKGLPLLIRAAGKLKGEDCQFRVKVIGDGPEGRSLQDLAASSGFAIG